MSPRPRRGRNAHAPQLRRTLHFGGYVTANGDDLVFLCRCARRLHGRHARSSPDCTSVACVSPRQRSDDVRPGRDVDPAAISPSRARAAPPHTRGSTRRATTRSLQTRRPGRRCWCALMADRRRRRGCSLDISVQYWTSRGFAYLDVDYGGSTGYGRTYRERLNGQGGVVDVGDCVAGAQHLVGDGCRRSGRLFIQGAARAATWCCARWCSMTCSRLAQASSASPTSRSCSSRTRTS